MVRRYNALAIFKSERATRSGEYKAEGIRMQGRNAYYFLSESKFFYHKLLENVNIEFRFLFNLV